MSILKHDLGDIEYVKGLQKNLRVTFESVPGKEVMVFLEKLCHWYPNITDTLETNEVIARDAERRILGTLKTLIEHRPEVIVTLAKQEES